MRLQESEKFKRVG